jgi:hypothetical protein
MTGVRFPAGIRGLLLSSQRPYRLWDPPSLPYSQSELFYKWRFTINQFILAPSTLRPTTSDFFQPNPCRYIPYVTSSLTRELVCRLQLLLALASAVILMSESRGSHDRILLSQIRDALNLEGRDPVFISPRNSMSWL